MVFSQPKFVKNKLVSQKLISLVDYLPSTDLTLGINNVFSNYLEVKSVSHSEEVLKIVDGKVQSQIYVTIEYNLLKDIEEDFIFYLLGFNYNLESESDENVKFGYESFKMLSPVSTSEWQIGKSYKVTHVIENDGDIFQLKAGVQMGKKGKWDNLYVNENSQNKNAYLDLGWLNLNEKQIK